MNIYLVYREDYEYDEHSAAVVYAPDIGTAIKLCTDGLYGPEGCWTRVEKLGESDETEPSIILAEFRRPGW